VPINDPVRGVVAGTEVIISYVLELVFFQCICELTGILIDSFIAWKATILNNVGSELRKVKQTNIWIRRSRGGGLVLRTMTMPTANLGEIPCYFFEPQQKL